MAQHSVKTDQLITHIIEAIEDVKGEEICLLDLRDIDNAVCSYFIICNGNSNTQVKAIVNSVKRNVSRDLKDKPWHIEGMENAEWVLMDFVNVVVHVFQKSTRELYDVEGMWGDAKTTFIESE